MLQRNIPVTFPKIRNVTGMLPKVNFFGDSDLFLVARMTLECCQKCCPYDIGMLPKMLPKMLQECYPGNIPVTFFFQKMLPKC